MKLEEYSKIVNISKLITKDAPNSLVFQNYVEKKINNGYTDFNEFFQKNDKNKSHFIRLKNPQCSNSKYRGLKVCLFRDNLFRKKVVDSGTIIFKFEPTMKVMGFNNENCSQCGKCLINIGDGGEMDEIIRCKKCQFRNFCSEECRIGAKLEWHDLECEFIDFIRKELIPVSENGVIDADMDAYYEKTVLLIISAFRLLVKLARCEKDELMEIVMNMSDHLKLYQEYIKFGKFESVEQESIFKTTRDVFVPIMVSYFHAKLEEIRNDKNVKVQPTIKINRDGIIKLLFLIFVNTSSILDNFSNQLGLMFDPIFSMINHSCEPNCTLIWKDNGEILVKSIRKLKPGEEIFINYIPIRMPKDMRQKMLKNSFFFKCECNRCLKADNEMSDDMLPIYCKNCNQFNMGFVVENFEHNDSLPNYERKKMCCNCEEIINVDAIFQGYLEIFKFFKMLNPTIDKIEDLYNWNVENDNIMKMDDSTHRKSVEVLQKNYEILPITSWPMTMMLNIVKVCLQKREPFNLNVLRLAYLTDFVIEILMDGEELMWNNIGTSLYDLCVISTDYLYDQYLQYREGVDAKTMEIVGKGTFSLCVLSFMHLNTRFKESRDENGRQELERSQKDLVELSKEIRKLLEHCERGGGVQCRGFFEGFCWEVFVKSVSEYEEYLCSGGLCGGLCGGMERVCCCVSVSEMCRVCGEVFALQCLQCLQCEK